MLSLELCSSWYRVLTKKLIANSNEFYTKSVHVGYSPFLFQLLLELNLAYLDSLTTKWVLRSKLLPYRLCVCYWKFDRWDDCNRLMSYGDARRIGSAGVQSLQLPTCIGWIRSYEALLRGMMILAYSFKTDWNQDPHVLMWGERAGVVVLDRYEHAVPAGAKIYGEI